MQGERVSRKSVFETLKGKKNAMRKKHAEKDDTYSAEEDVGLSESLIKVAVDRLTSDEIHDLTKTIIQDWGDYDMLRRLLMRLRSQYPHEENYEMKCIEHYIEHVEAGHFNFVDLKIVINLFRNANRGPLKLGVFKAFMQSDMKNVDRAVANVMLLVARVICLNMDAELALSYLMVRGEGLDKQVFTTAFSNIFMVMPSIEEGNWQDAYRADMEAEVGLEQRLIKAIDNGIRINPEDFEIPQLVRVLKATSYHSISDDRLLGGTGSKFAILKKLTAAVKTEPALSAEDLMVMIQKMPSCFDAFSHEEEMEALILAISAKKYNECIKAIAAITLRKARDVNLKVDRIFRKLANLPEEMLAYRYELTRLIWAQEKYVAEIWQNTTCLIDLKKFLGDALLKGFICSEMSKRVLKQLVENRVVLYIDIEGLREFVFGGDYEEFLAEIKTVASDNGRFFSRTHSIRLRREKTVLDELEEALEIYKTHEEKFHLGIRKVIDKLAKCSLDAERALSRLWARDTEIDHTTLGSILDRIVEKAGLEGMSWVAVARAGIESEKPKKDRLVEVINQGMRFCVEDFKLAQLVQVLALTQGHLPHEQILGGNESRIAVLKRVIKFVPKCTDVDMVCLIKNIPSYFNAFDDNKEYAPWIGKLVQTLILNGRFESVKAIATQAIQIAGRDEIPLRLMFEALRRPGLKEPMFVREATKQIWGQRDHVTQIWSDEGFKLLLVLNSLVGDEVMSAMVTDSISKKCLKELVANRQVAILNLYALKQSKKIKAVDTAFYKEMEQAQAFTVAGRTSLAGIHMDSPVTDRRKDSLARGTKYDSMGAGVHLVPGPGRFNSDA